MREREWQPMIKESTPDLCAVINREQSQKLFSITAGNFLSTGSQIQRADHHKAESQERKKKERGETDREVGILEPQRQRKTSTPWKGKGHEYT